MTNKTRLMKGLLAGSAITALSAGSAFAQITPNNYTPAGTPVANTFTLNYEVGNVPQQEITNDGTFDPGDPNNPANETVFTVDRLVNLTVDSDGDNTVAPGATDEQLTFSVLNTGNDTHGYALSIVEESTAPDTIDTDDPASATPVIVYYIDDGDGVYEPGGDDGVAITYDGADPAAIPQLGPDELAWVTIIQDIPAGAVDGDRAEISLVADALDAGTTNPTVADGDGNSLTGDAENVLADGTSTGNEVANAGDDSATGAYVVAAANITAIKTVSVFSEDGTNCSTIPGTPDNGFAVPQACIEYQIAVTNTGSDAATDIVINDILADELEFVTAQFNGDFTGGSFASPALPASGTDCTGGACVVNLQNATLPAPVAPATETSGTVIIRAIVK